VTKQIYLLILLLSLSDLSVSQTLRAYLVTTPASNNISEVHIINPSDNSQNYTGTLYSSSGKQVGPNSVALHGGSIRAQGRLILSSSQIADLFDTLPWQGPAMLEISADSDFKVMIKLKSPSGFISNTNCVTTDSVHNIEGADQRDRTYIRFINIGSERISNVTGSLYRANGTIIGSADRTIISSLDPKEQVWVNNEQLEGIFDSSWSGPATLDVRGHSNLRLLNLNYVNSETFFNFSCFEGTFAETNVVNQANTPSWELADLAGNWFGQGDALAFSAPDCTGSLSVQGTMSSNGYFSGTARSFPSNYSLSFDAFTLTDGSLLVMGMAVDYSIGYGASFSGKFYSDSVMRIWGRDTDNCFTQFDMIKR